MQDATEMLGRLGDEWATFRKRSEAKADKLSADLDSMGRDLAELQLKATRPSMGESGGGASDSKALGQALRKAFQGDDREIKAMSVGDDSAGGFLAVPQMDNAIRLIRDQVSPVSSMARTIMLTEGAEVLLPRANGTLTSGWTGESDTRSVTDSLAVGMDRIVLHEIYAQPQVTQKLLDTAHYDIGAIIIDQIGHGLAVAEDIALHTGNGVARPRGFATHTTSATADATRTWGEIQHIPTGASGAWHTTYADPLFDMVAALAPQYRANAKWLMSRATLATIRKFKASTADYVFRPGLVVGEADTLLGFPVVLSENVATIAANSLSIFFGDFQAAYTVVRMPGIRLLTDPYTVKGSVNFYAFQRVGGGLVNSDAIKALKFSAT